uniref:uncharacterized protein LOC114584649 n=1 Tax=Podarcis muralis TaxID=64176 RepID=UPI00109F1672|nr:uncharacterized protein LOC114584649 [Podarcis muralis]
MPRALLSLSASFLFFLPPALFALGRSVDCRPRPPFPSPARACPSAFLAPPPRLDGTCGASPQADIFGLRGLSTATFKVPALYPSALGGGNSNLSSSAAKSAAAINPSLPDEWCCCCCRRLNEASGPHLASRLPLALFGLRRGKEGRAALLASPSGWYPELPPPSPGTAAALRGAEGGPAASRHAPRAPARRQEAAKEEEEEELEAVLLLPPSSLLPRRLHRLGLPRSFLHPPGRPARRLPSARPARPPSSGAARSMMAELFMECEEEELEPWQQKVKPIVVDDDDDDEPIFVGEILSS